MLTGLTAGTCTLTPGKSGYTFSPPSRTVTVLPNAVEQNFVGTPVPIKPVYLPLLLRGG